MAIHYGNVNGKAYAITVITPIKPWTTWVQKLILWAAGLFPGTTDRLVKLSFIHFARWVIVKKNRFPRLVQGQPRESLAYDYLLFDSNFNGTWSQYIDGFSDVLPDGLNTIWNWSVKFPGSRPGQSFKRYIRFNQIDTDHYYTAYPGAAINDIKAARRVHDAFIEFAEIAGGLSPDQFQTAYNKLLLGVQKDLGSTGPAPTPASD